ncbi:MAG TPA: restriction endonuclease subunit S, partial [Prolixibacteraceae bacterium]|nr:restriction endonuclease subunit S [Prolixibacteraceae bacterium]
TMESKNIDKATQPFINNEIPHGWEVSLLDNLTKRGSGHTPDKEFEEYYNGGIKWISLADSYRLDKGVISETEIEISELGIKKSSAVIHPAGTVLMSRDAGVGKSAVMGIDMSVSQHFIVWRCLEKLDNWFLYYWLQYKKEYFERQAVGSTIKTIGLPLFKKLTILHPKYKEQRAIAHLLLKWDEAITKTQSLITQKELRKKWLMQHLLTGKKRVKGFEGEWKEYSYNKLLKIVKRPVIWNDNELYNLISVRRRSGGIFLREALYGHQIKVKDLRSVNEGDFLFSKMQILHGASALVTKEFAGAKISGSYIDVVAKDPQILNMEYFNWYTKNPYFYHQTYISSYGVHIEKMTFDFETFLSLEMNLPSIEEQIAIVQVLQAADKEIQLLKAKVEKLKEQKKGLMQVLLTGKKRLKID